MEESLERAVVQYVYGFRREHIDAEGLRFAKTLLKDQIAVQAGASQLPWSRDVRRCLAKPRPGEASVVADAQRMDAGDAAYLNAVYGGGFEYDDVAGNGHPGCCVVPVALAVGEELGATLGEVLEAMVAGYEAYVRIGRLASPDLVNRGWHPHSVLAHFGAAAVAAKLHRCAPNTIFNALGIALSHACGTTEYTSTGGSIKRVHAGIAARNGIASAELARGGITGPRQWLTGKKGFYRTFIGRAVDAEAAATAFGPDAPLLLKQAWFKAYCACGAHHPYIDAMAQIRPRAGEVEAIDAKVQAMTQNLAARPEVAMNGPRTIEELQFSPQLQMAFSALGLGNGYATHMDFLAGRLTLSPDGEVVQLARRIQLQHAPELDQRFPRNFVADVTVRYRDGSSETLFVEHALGMPGRPFTSEQHQAKLEELSFGPLGEARARRLFALIDELDPALPVHELAALIRH
ncbi:MmgE/PrpD family protein [Variovorax defluvii]|uniref:MmgE/PrpD family protein n=1 Tax=Variovorax defluvii TaxID=913761 RepID=UPI0031EE58B9